MLVILTVTVVGKRMKVTAPCIHGYHHWCLKVKAFIIAEQNGCAGVYNDLHTPSHDARSSTRPQTIRQPYLPGCISLFISATPRFHKITKIDPSPSRSPYLFSSRHAMQISATAGFVVRVVSVWTWEASINPFMYNIGVQDHLNIYFCISKPLIV